VPRRTRCANYAAPEGMETRGPRVRRRSSRRRRKRGRAGLTVPYRALRCAFCNGGARAKLGEELIEEWRTHGGGTAEAELGLQWRRWRSARAGRGRESEREGAEGRKWERGRRRARPGAPGGRPGRVLAAACPPRGGRALPACHGAAASAVRARTRARARGRGRGERGRAEPASASGPEARPRPASAPFSPFFFFLKFFSQILFQQHFDYFQIIFTIFTQKQSCSKIKTLQLCFNKQDQIPNRI
jgi:hypothetical protein